MEREEGAGGGKKEMRTTDHSSPCAGWYCTLRCFRTSPGFFVSMLVMTEPSTPLNNDTLIKWLNGKRRRGTMGRREDTKKERGRRDIGVA